MAQSTGHPGCGWLWWLSLRRTLCSSIRNRLVHMIADTRVCSRRSGGKKEGSVTPSVSWSPDAAPAKPHLFQRLPSSRKCSPLPRVCAPHTGSGPSLPRAVCPHVRPHVRFILATPAAHQEPGLGGHSAGHLLMGSKLASRPWFFPAAQQCTIRTLFSRMTSWQGDLGTLTLLSGDPVPVYTSSNGGQEWVTWL